MRKLASELKVGDRIVQGYGLTSEVLSAEPRMVSGTDVLLEGAYPVTGATLHTVYAEGDEVEVTEMTAEEVFRAYPCTSRVGKSPVDAAPNFTPSVNPIRRASGSEAPARPA